MTDEIRRLHQLLFPASRGRVLSAMAMFRQSDPKRSVVCVGSPNAKLCTFEQTEVYAIEDHYVQYL